MPNTSLVPLLSKRHFLVSYWAVNCTVHSKRDSTNPIEVWSLSEMMLSSLGQEMGNGREGISQNEVEFIIVPSGRTLKWKFCSLEAANLAKSRRKRINE